MPLFPGQATAEGTRAFADRSINSGRTVRPHFRKSSTGLDLSSLGLGTYIGPPDAPTDLAVEQAVTVCLQSGRINAIDTAINYRYQRAERSIGRA
ncbi:MAG: aldo/keto reductase, partial [Thermoplasmata archaeon]